jgi:hypothetical protein
VAKELAQLRERSDPRAVGVAIQIADVQQHGLDACRARADDVDVKEIADVDGRGGSRADAIEGDLEKSRIGFFDAFVARIEQRVDR